MRRILFGAALALLAAATPADAIINGTPDGDDHPNVGAIVAAEPYPDGTYAICSGTLIAPDVFLTAAHCGDEDAQRVLVTFDSAYEAGDPVHAGTFHPDPAYPGPASDAHDIAVIVLDEAVEGIEPARLPEAGSLSDLRRGRRFTSVGYGANEVVNGPGGKDYVYDDVRMQARGRLKAVNKTWLRIGQNVANGDGGTCYGDSGGPNFLGTSDVVAAITITGDSACRATNVAYRTDTPSAREFLDDHVELP